MSSETQTTATAAIVEPLTEMEAALLATVTKWREDRRQSLEIAWQKVLSEANERIMPILRAHGLQPGDDFEIADDENAKTGISITIKKGGAAPEGTTPPATIPINRGTRRRLQKEIGARVRGAKPARKGGR